MSRNIGDILCQFCGTDNFKLIEEERFITKEDAGFYFDEYEGMIVADAECKRCKAQYLAWIDGSKRKTTNPDWMSGYPDRTSIPENYAFRDLSFKNSFNDEPDLLLDTPIYNTDGTFWSIDKNHSFKDVCYICEQKPSIYYSINYEFMTVYIGFCDEHKNRARTNHPLWVISSFEEILILNVLES